MIAASIVIICALRTTLLWVGEAVSGMVGGGGEGGHGNDGQENNDGEGVSFVGVMIDDRVGDGEDSLAGEGWGDFRGNFGPLVDRYFEEDDEDWDAEMVAESLNYLGDTINSTRGYAPCWRSPFEQSFRGYRVYFQDGTWTDVYCG